MAVQTGEGYHGRYEVIGGARRREYEATAHPVVRSHPVTGCKAIFVNAPFTDHIVGLNRTESDALLNFLYAPSVQSNFQYHFKWRKNSIAFWDNRCIEHHATWGYYPQTRSGIRVTIKRGKPFH